MGFKPKWLQRAAGRSRRLRLTHSFASSLSLTFLFAGSDCFCVNYPHTRLIAWKLIKQLAVSHCIQIKADHRIKLGEINTAQGLTGNNSCSNGITVTLQLLTAGLICLFNSKLVTFFFSFIAVFITYGTDYVQEITQMACNVLNLSALQPGPSVLKCRLSRNTVQHRSIQKAFNTR